MPISKDPSVYRWKCGRCQTWNEVERGVCKTCNSMQSETATAFRMKSLLTTEENIFYAHTAPRAVHELVKIRELLAELLSEFREVNNV